MPFLRGEVKAISRGDISTGPMIFSGLYKARLTMCQLMSIIYCLKEMLVLET